MPCRLHAYHRNDKISFRDPVQHPMELCQNAIGCYTVSSVFLRFAVCCQNSGGLVGIRLYIRLVCGFSAVSRTLF